MSCEGRRSTLIEVEAFENHSSTAFRSSRLRKRTILAWGSATHMILTCCLPVGGVAVRRGAAADSGGFD